MQSTTNYKQMENKAEPFWTPELIKGMKLWGHLVIIGLFIILIVLFVLSLVGWTTHLGWQFCEAVLPTACNTTIAPKICTWN